MPKEGFIYRFRLNDNADLGQILQIYIEDANPSTIHTRTYFIDRWNVWTKYAGVKNEST